MWPENKMNVPKYVRRNVQRERERERRRRFRKKLQGLRMLSPRQTGFEGKCQTLVHLCLSTVRCVTEFTSERPFTEVEVAPFHKNTSLKRSEWHVLTRDHTALPAINTFIHE